MAEPRATPPPRAGAWPGSELGARVASSLVLGLLALLVAYLGGWPFALFWLAAGLAILVEWLAMTRVAPRRPAEILLGAGIVALAAIGPGLLPLPVGLGLALAAAAATGILVLRSTQARRWALSGFAYAAVIAVAPPLVRESPSLGLAALLWMFAVVWSTDIAAYFAGRRFGGPKLWPSVSPKKTWSGFAGGLIAGVAAGMAVALAAARLGAPAPVGLPAIAALSALASVLGQLGDLGESALKRHCGVKDSGRLIPGHGGVMDRLDAFWSVSLLIGVLMAGAWAFGG